MINDNKIAAVANEFKDKLIEIEKDNLKRLDPLEPVKIIEKLVNKFEEVLLQYEDN